MPEVAAAKAAADRAAAEAVAAHAKTHPDRDSDSDGHPVPQAAGPDHLDGSDAALVSEPTTESFPAVPMVDLTGSGSGIPPDQATAPAPEHHARHPVSYTHLDVYKRQAWC